MFSRENLFNQLWNIVIGAIVVIVALIAYFVLGLVDTYIVQLARSYVTSWVGRAFLLVVSLYGVGFVIAKLFRGKEDS